MPQALHRGCAFHRTELPANHTRCGIRRGLTTPIHHTRLTGRLSQLYCARHGFQVYTYWRWSREAEGRYTLSTTSSDSRLRFTMAIQQRKQTSIILTFRILQFVNQLRRRVKPRVLDGSINASSLGLRIFPALRRNTRRFSRISIRDAKQSRCIAQRICKARQRSPESSRSSLRPSSAAPASRNVASHEVQQYVQEAFVLFHLLKLRT
jgi:hypothetical protein